MHEEGYGVTLNDAGRAIYTRPNGEVLSPSPLLPAINDPMAEVFKAINRDRGLEIDAETTIPAWTGEPMDYCTGVETLQRLDGWVF